MSAKDLKYIPAPAGEDPLGPMPLPSLNGYQHPYPWIVDAKGNWETGMRYDKNGGIINKIKYKGFDDQSGDGFNYTFNVDNKVRGFSDSNVSDLRAWSYNPHKAATHPDYNTRKGNIASWDRVKGIPTVSKVMPVRDGD
jgi:hypothetical protein